MRVMLNITVNTPDIARPLRHNRSQSEGDVSVDCEPELVPVGSQDDLALLDDIPPSKLSAALQVFMDCA